MSRVSKCSPRFLSTIPALARRLLLGALALPMLVGAACAPNPADGVPSALAGTAGEALGAAEPGDAASRSADDAAPEEADVAASDAAEEADESGFAMQPIDLDGTIAFLGSKVTGSHDCRFADWRGTIDPGAGTAETASLSFTVQTASLYCDAEAPSTTKSRFEQHMVDEDFFWSTMYPEATFVSTSIAEGGEGGATHTISGDLTIRGVSQPISFPATVSVTPERVDGSAEFVIDRQLWDMAYPGKPDDLIRDEVVIAIDLTGRR